jgi:hypothetical protein
MFVLWSIYLCCNLMFFEEPDRKIELEKSPAASSSHVKSAEGAISVKAKANIDTSPLLNYPMQVANGGPSEAANTFSKSSFIWNVADVFRTRKYQPLNLLRTSVNIPMLITMILIALLKTILEGLSSSAPTISRHYFGWGVHSSGIYLAVQASFVLPTTFFISQISRKHDDRELILGTLLVMLVGILGFLVYGDGGYSESRFIFFGIVIFSACNALEVPTMVSRSVAVLISCTMKILIITLLFAAGLIKQNHPQELGTGSSKCRVTRNRGRYYGARHWRHLVQQGNVSGFGTDAKPNFYSNVCNGWSCNCCRAF